MSSNALHRRSRNLLTCLCLLLAWLGAAESRAHNLGESYLYLQVYEDSLTGRFEVGLSDLNPAFGLSGTADEITGDNLDEHISFLQRYYLDHVKLADANRPLAIEFKEHDLLNAHDGFVLMPFELSNLQGVPEVLTIDYSVLFDEEPSHRGFLLIEHNWATGTFANENRTSLTFQPGEERQDFELTSKDRWRGFVAVVKLGVHRFWNSIHQILFLIALLLPTVLYRDGRKRRQWLPIKSLSSILLNVARVVISFAVAHSVGLWLGFMDIVSLPERWVEVMVAVSIALVAIDFLVPLLRGRSWLIAATFGVFHGFAFAWALLKQGMGENLGLSVFAFNLGIEIGQLIMVAILLPILLLARHLWLYRKVGLPVAAVLMIWVAGVWVTERAFEIDLPLRELLPAAVQKVIP